MDGFAKHPLTLKLLGTLEIGPEGDDRAGELLRHRKRLALLVYLAAQPPGRRVQRDTLTWLFWPDSNDVRARNALSQALHVLRRAAGPDAIFAEGDHVRANPDVVASDVQAFRRDLEAGRPAEALERYRGNLLEGFHLAGLAEFEEWMAAERDTVRRSAVKAAWQAAALAEAAEDREGALRYARRALDLAPLEEEGTRRLMALHLRYGDRAGAVQAYEVLARTMAAELGVEPSPETRDAFEAVRRGDPPESLRTPHQALAESGAARQTAAVADGGDGAGVSVDGSAPGVGPGAGPVDASRLPPRPPMAPHRFGGDRWRPLRWAAAGAVVLGAFLFATSVAWDGSPPVSEGTLAVVNEASTAPGGDAVATRLVELLSGADFPTAVLNPSAADRETLAGRLREEGIEALLRLDAAPEGMRATLVRLRDGRLLGVVPLPDSLDEAAAADRAAGLAALHLDRRIASWGQASSVVPGYRAFQAFHEAMAAWRDGRNQDRTAALERAVSLEPWFPLALLELAGRELARTPPVDSLLHAVAAERPHLSEVEGLHVVYLEAGHARNLVRQYEAARTLAERLPERFLEAAATLALELGRHEEALSLATRVPAASSAFRVPAGVPIAALHALGRHEDELEMARELGGDWVNLEVDALAALGRVEEIQALLRKRAAQPAFPGLAAADLNVRAGAIVELRLHGHETEAQRLIDEGLRFLESPAGEDIAVIVRIRFHRAAGRLDDWERATRESLERALREIPEWSGRYWHVRDLGLIAAARGDVEAALHYEAQVAAFAEDTTLAFHPRDHAAITASRARIHAALGNEEDAVHLLTRALALGLSHVDIRTAPEFARLRGNPDFDRLVPAPTF